MERSILEGDLSELPDEDSNIIRIFTCSTSKDMDVERNYLMKNIYTQLRNTCLGLGLEFEVVDMRWGVNDEMGADDETNELCLREISNCQRLSQGPNFMTFIGDKYGTRPLPTVIAEDEYETLLKILIDSGRDATVLQTWFKKDENFIPPKYVLQPIDMILLHYSDKSNTPERNEDRKKWREILQEIQKLLEEAVQKAIEEKFLTVDTRDKYVMSVTESEVIQGIFSIQDPATRCACFVRVLKDIPHCVDDVAVKLYFDDADCNVSSIARQRLDGLRFERIKKVLDKMTFNYFEVSWRSVGIDPTINEHGRYLKQLGESVKSVLQNHIHTFSDKRLQNGIISRSKLLTEVLHHSSFVVRTCSAFYGREELLDSLKFSLRPKIKITEQDVFVIHGPPGSGKTSICAMLVKNARMWFHEPTMVVISRFLGTSPSSNDICGLISSLCDQICKVYSLQTTSHEAIDVNLMIQNFHCLLQHIESPQLLIVLDSINQLSPEDNAYMLNWLPNHLNKNVSIVVSTLPAHGNIFNQLKKRYSFPDNFLEVGSLSSNSSSIILHKWFAERNRKLMPEQQGYLLKCCLACPKPIYLQAAFDQAVKWKSHDTTTAISLPATINSMISSLFRKIEIECGEMLVSHALGYITASKNGLTESELKDILSLDDLLLSEVFESHDPPSEHFIRLPCLLWKRIRYQLDTFLAERQSDGSIVLNWSHRQFREAATDRYLSDETKVQHLYFNLSDYFLGKYSNGNGKTISLTKRNKILEDADRQVQAQPLVFSKGLYNLRKLTDMPFVLIKCNKQNELFQYAFFNFQWIECKVKGTSVRHVLEDLQQYLAMHDDQEVKIIHDALLLVYAHSQIDGEQNSLACQLLGTLTGFEDAGMKNIKKLLRECRRHIHAVNNPVLLLRSACMIPPGGTLQATLQGHSGKIEKIMFLDGINDVICTCRDKQNNFYVHFWSVSERCSFKIIKFTCSGYANAIWLKGWENVIIISDQLSYVNIYTQIITLTVKNLNGSISCVRERSDGKLLVIAHTNGLIRFFDVEMRKFITEFDEWKGICCMEFLSNSTEVAISSNSQPTLVLLNHSNHQARHFESPRNNMKSSSNLLTMANDSVLISSSHEMIHAWDVINVAYSYSLEDHHDKIFCMEKINEDAFASGSEDNSIKIWSVGQRALLNSLPGHQNAISCLKYCQSSKRLFSGSRDDYVKIWNVETSMCDDTLRGHSSWVSCVDVSYDGSVIASGSADRQVKIWNTALNKNQTKQPNFIHHHKLCSGVVMSANGSYVATTSANEKLILWHESKRIVLRELEGNVTCAAFSSQSSKLILGTKEGVVKVYDMSGEMFNLCFSHKSHYKSVFGLFHLDQTQTVVSAGDDGNVTICDLHFKEELQRLEYHNDAVTSFHLSYDKTVLVTGGRDKTVNVFHISSGENIRHAVKLDGHEKAVSCLDTSVRNEYLLSGDRTGVILLWQLSTGENIRKIKASEDTLVHLFLSESKVISASHDSINQLRMWDITSGEVLIEYEAHSHSVLCVRCTADNKYMLSSSRDSTIKLWEISSGEVLDSINFNSHIKYFDISKLCEGRYYKAVGVTKTGSVAFMRILLPEMDHASSMNGTLILMDENNLPDSPTNFIPVQTRKCCCII